MNERHKEIASALPVELDSLLRLKGFRLRGIQMTRLETFIDAAFAFGIEPPNALDSAAHLNCEDSFIAKVLRWRAGYPSRFATCSSSYFSIRTPITSMSEASG